MPINLDIQIPQQYQSIVTDIVNKAQSKDIDVLLSNDVTVSCNGSPCNGFFQDVPKLKLAVACGREPEHWLQVLLHESSHMDQWIEQSPYWTSNNFCGVESIDIMELYVQHYIDFDSAKRKWEIISAARNVELDCERRTAEKIEKLDIGITKQQYTQRANAYVLFYNIVGEYRQWYLPGREPYRNPEICDVMPKVFYDDEWYQHWNTPREIQLALLKCIEGEGQ